MIIKKNHPYLIVEVEETDTDLTIRTLLQRYALSKKTIHQLYMEKAITVNKETVSFDKKLNPNDQVSILVFKEEGLDFKPQDIPLEIVYEDDHLLMVNKPAGLMVHPDSKDKGGTLVNAVAHYYQSKKYLERVRYIHRIDTETSGLVIFAKHFFVHALLDEWLSKKIIKRHYLALVSGTLKPQKGVINKPIGRDRHHPSRRRVAKNGDVAVTHYHVVKNYQTYSLVKLTLQTGRTHQIRVHMSDIGHPLLSDTLYGGRKMKALNRHALHAYEVSMPHPITNQLLHVVCELPSDLSSLT